MSQLNPNQFLFGEQGSRVAWMKRSKLSLHQEYDRSSPLSRNNPGGHSYSPEEWRRQQESVRSEGIKSPLVVHFHQPTGRAIIGEGNHRLVWAREAGHLALPVRVTSYSDESRFPAGSEIEGGSVWPQNKPVPGDITPRQVFPEHYFQKPEWGREIPVGRTHAFLEAALGQKVGRADVETWIRQQRGMP